MIIKDIKKKLDNREPLTNGEKMAYMNYAITIHDENGKMAGNVSYSTSCLDNATCEKRSKNPDLICSKCYARKDLKRKKTLREKMRYNTIFFTCYDLNIDCIPLLNYITCRFEAFGEIKNIQQVKNYYTIARKNPDVYFVLWTKNAHIIARAEKCGYIKPDNFRIIAGDPMINGITASETLSKYDFIEKVFSAYTKEYAEKHNIAINCSGKCNACNICYDPENTTSYINELIK